MTNDFNSQIYMLMGLSQLNMGINNNGDNTNFRYLLPIIITFSPIIIKLFNIFYEFVEEFVYGYDNEKKYVSIKFPVHEIKIQKDAYSKDSSVRQLYSTNYLAINNYIRENLKNISGITNLVEILNLNMDYYSEDFGEKNFVLIPFDSTEILLSKEKQIYCKIKSCEKNFNNNDDKDKKDNIQNEKVKNYELILFAKLDTLEESEKKDKLILLDEFIEDCVCAYNKKNDEKYENKHLIYEYTHSVKDEYYGIELKFKEYVFENNKDLDKNIFFEHKEKLIKYVDKFIYNEDEIKKKKINIYEEEYKKIGYTYKATFLFYGKPGCGKTSTIKAILNRTKRHGIIINWNRIKTCQELEFLFRNRIINNRDYDARELCLIIEDCDATKNNILLSRKNDINFDDDDITFLENKKTKQTKQTNQTNQTNQFNQFNQNDLDMSIIEFNKMIEDFENSNDLDKVNMDKLVSIEKILKKISSSKYPSVNLDNSKLNDDSLNLSCLLNVLDGIIELHGIMIIFSTNHPEKLDEAFLRPGRIDFKQEFKRANKQTIISIFKSKFDIEDDDDNNNNINNNKITIKFIKEKFIDYVLSPAEIQSICFKHDNLNECIEELLLEQKKYINRLKEK